MLFFLVHLVSAWPAVAQLVPSELPLSAEQQLSVSFPESNTSVDTPGQRLQLPRQSQSMHMPPMLMRDPETLQLPTLATDQHLPGKHIFILYDPDGVQSTDHLANPLHALYTDIESSTTSSVRGEYNLSPGTPLAPYAHPQPPNSSIHQYTLLLYRQPANFTFPLDPLYYQSLDRSARHSRWNFPILEVLQQSGLGYRALAATYFREAAPLNASVPAAPSINGSRSYPIPYTGIANARHSQDFAFIILMATLSVLIVNYGDFHEQV